MESNTNTKNWPDLALGLYDRLTERNSEITYKLSNMEVFVPSVVGEDAEHAHWKVNGAITISTDDKQPRYSDKDIV